MPHSYLIASTNTQENSLWVHVNAEHGPEYTDNRTTVLEMRWADEPSIVKVSPPSALTSESWNFDTGVLTLSLSHSDGAVDVTVEE